MSESRTSRNKKKQLGQFLTPYEVARRVVDLLPSNPNARVLEPSFGKGAFVCAYLDKLKDEGVAIDDTVLCNIEGCEIDRASYDHFLNHCGYGISRDNFSCCDFFRYRMPSFSKAEYFARVQETYDLIIGNPPFGGTIDYAIQDELDAIFGFRNGNKIKKETYAFFIVKSLDLLKSGGKLLFICSDTLLTINTMSGLRQYLMDTCRVEIMKLPGEFSETSQPMVVLMLTKGGRGVKVFGEEKSLDQIGNTGNYSWAINSEYAKYFNGYTLADFMTATSGMTVGKNEYFLREVVDGKLIEPYLLKIGERPVTLESEIERARLGKVSARKIREIKERQQNGECEKCVEIVKRERPLVVNCDDDDYALYNKSTNAIVYAKPKWRIYWKNGGEAVYTFKKSGAWYLHGVGGKPFFMREGITWQLISSHMNMRYLPSGYILDSGAPCAFVNQGVDRDEMFFIMGWCLTRKCNEILKKVINHTRNIQSKDFERLPYPAWVCGQKKDAVIRLVKGMIDEAVNGRSFNWSSGELSTLDELFRLESGADVVPLCQSKNRLRQSELWEC